MIQISPLQESRYDYKPKLPEAIKGDVNKIKLELGNPTESVSDKKEIKVDDVIAQSDVYTLSISVISTEKIELALKKSGEIEYYIDVELI